MNSILAFVLIPAGLLATGQCLLRFFAPFSRDLRGNTYAFLLGLVVFSYFWFAAGLFGRLHVSTLYVYEGLAGFCLIAARRELSGFFKDLSGALEAIRKSDRLTILAFLLLLIVLIATLSRCWTGHIDTDSLVYHLYLPKQYVMKAALWAVPYSEHAFWPQFAEMCFIPGELIHALALSKLISGLVFLATLALIGQSVYRITQNKTAAVLSAFWIASAPVFFSHASSTYSDLFFNLFLVAALLLYREQRETAFASGGTAMFLAGLFGGAAMASKYLALYGILALGSLMAIDLVLARSKARVFKCIALFAAGLLITGLPYYVRSYLQYANPVFPFAAGFFGTPFGYLIQNSGGLVAAPDLFAGAGRSFLDFLSLPWNLTFRPDLFGGDKLGLFFLLLSPFVFFAWKQNKRSLLYCLIYALCWFFQMQFSRYLLPVYSLLAFMMGQGYHFFEIKFPRLRPVVLAGILALGVFQAGWSVYRAYKEFFVHQETEIAQMAGTINQWVQDPAAQVLILGSYGLYYYDFVAIREKGFRNFTRYPDLADPAKLTGLLDEKGITRILIIESPSPWYVTDDAHPQSFFDSAPYFKALIAANFYVLEHEKQGVEATYRLYRRAP